MKLCNLTQDELGPSSLYHYGIFMVKRMKIMKNSQDAGSRTRIFIPPSANSEYLTLTTRPQRSIERRKYATFSISAHSYILKIFSSQVKSFFFLFLGIILYWFEFHILLREGTFYVVHRLTVYILGLSFSSCGTYPISEQQF